MSISRVIRVWNAAESHNVPYFLFSMQVCFAQSVVPPVVDRTKQKLTVGLSVEPVANELSRIEKRA